MNPSQTGTFGKPSALEQLGPVARVSLRFFFALLLAVTGVAKLLDMPGFYAVVRSYQSLPDLVVPASSWLLALGEVVLAGWLVSRRQQQLASVIVILLHLMYLGWLLMALMRGLEISNCGCFGVFWARPLTWLSPLEDLALVLLAIGYWRLLPRSAS